MPEGAALTIRTAACEMVSRLREAGEVKAALRLGDIRDHLGMTSKLNADVRQVLDSTKFREEARVQYLCKSGPNEGASTIYHFRIIR